MSVILIGAGGHARVLLDILRASGIAVVGAVDKQKAPGSKLGDVEVLGSDEVLRGHDPSKIRLVNAVGSTGDNQARERIFVQMKSLGFSFETLVHPSAIVSSSALVREGAQIMAGAIVQSGARIESNVIINSGAIVEHDCVIESHAHVAPGVVLSGSVRVGKGAHLGTGATVIQGIEIGSYSLVGAGAVVVSNVPDRTQVLGIPARARDA
jgi:sugar O-acyltransferase (sialic acid O-acetyltransferase NeuD family)